MRKRLFGRYVFQFFRRLSEKRSSRSGQQKSFYLCFAFSCFKTLKYCRMFAVHGNYRNILFFCKVANIFTRGNYRFFVCERRRFVRLDYFYCRACSRHAHNAVDDELRSVVFYRFKKTVFAAENFCLCVRNPRFQRFRRGFIRADSKTRFEFSYLFFEQVNARMRRQRFDFAPEIFRNVKRLRAYRACRTEDGYSFFCEIFYHFASAAIPSAITLTQQNAADVNITLSNLSIMPPCPGMSFP